MKKQTKQNGITLIALVITIIILLILAGISISALTGSGLFDKTSEAKSAQEMAQAQEELELKIYEATIENKGYLTLQILAEYLDKDTNNTYVIEVGQTATVDGKIPDLSNAKSMIVTYKKLDFEITDKFEVTCLEETTEVISINYTFNSDKEYTKEDIILTITATSTDGNITGIQETQADGLSKNQDGTYTITENGNYEFTVIDSAGNTKTKAIPVNNIDKLIPSKVEVKAKKLSLTSFTAQIMAEDAASDEKNAQSGIEKYEYYIKESSSTDDYIKSESNNDEKEFSGLESGKKYSIYVRAYDKANNYKDSEEIEVETLTTPAPAIGKITFNEANSTVQALDYPTLTLNGMMNCEIVPNEGENIKIEITTSAPSDISYYYSLDGGTTWNLYTEAVETQYVAKDKIKTKAIYNEDTSITSEIYTLKKYKKDLNYSCTVSDAIGSLTYDGRYDEAQTLNPGRKYIKVAPECWGKYVNVYAETTGTTSTYGCASFHDSDKTTVILDDYMWKLSGCDGNDLKTKSVKIPVNTCYIQFRTGTSGSSVHYDIYEIWLSDESLNGTKF